MNSRQLVGRGTQGYFETQSLGNGVSRGFQDVFSTMDAMYTCTTGNNAVEMSQAFHNIAQFERFTDRNPLRYAFNVIQNWETYALQFYSKIPIFCQQLQQKEMKAAS